MGRLHRRGGFARTYVLRTCSDVLLARHVALLLCKGLARWRLETFGLYMPSLPGTRPWWRVNRRAVCVLVRQRTAYARWLLDMRNIRLRGDSGWWKTRSEASYASLRAYAQSQNAPRPDDEAGC